MGRKRKNTTAESTDTWADEPPARSVEHVFLELSENTTRHWLWILMGVNCALVVCDFIFNYGQVLDAPQLRRLFNIAREDSLANWISSLETLLVACSLGVVALCARRARHGKAAVRAWIGFASFFLFLAADDGAKIHERVGPVARDLATRTPASEMPWYGSYIDWVGGYSWHAVVLPFFILVGVALFVFCWKQFRQTSLRGMLTCAFLLLTLAVGLDYFEGWFRNVPGDMFGGWERYTISHFQKTFEEFCEMTASCLLFYVFSTHALTLFQTVELHAISPASRSKSRR